MIDSNPFFLKNSGTPVYSKGNAEMYLCHFEDSPWIRSRRSRRPRCSCHISWGTHADASRCSCSSALLSSHGDSNPRASVSGHDISCSPLATAPIVRTSGCVCFVANTTLRCIRPPPASNHCCSSAVVAATGPPTRVVKQRFLPSERHVEVAETKPLKSRILIFVLQLLGCLPVSCSSTLRARICIIFCVGRRSAAADTRVSRGSQHNHYGSRPAG